MCMRTIFRVCTFAQALEVGNYSKVDGCARNNLFNIVIISNYFNFLPPFSTVKCLLERTILSSEGNSLLIIGPRGCGKSWVSRDSSSKDTSNI